MDRTFALSLAAAALVAAPSVIQAQQSHSAGAELRATGGASFQLQLTTDSVHAAQPGATILSASPPTSELSTSPQVITLQVAPNGSAKSENDASFTKSEKLKSDHKKKAVKGKGAPQTTGQTDEREDNGDQAWETEFLVDRAQDSAVPAIFTRSAK